VYENPAGGTAVWSETQSVTFEDGYYNAELGGTIAIDPDIMDGDDYYLGIAVGTGAELSDRLPLHSVPFAFHSLSAQSVSGGGVVDASSIEVGGVTVIDSAGKIEYSSLLNVPASSDTLLDLGCTATGSVAIYSGTAWACGTLQTDASALTSGTISPDRLTFGTSATTVAAGNHVHTSGFNVSAQTSDYSILASEADGNTAISNEGASAPVVYTLPAAEEGLKIQVVRSADFGVSVLPAGTDTINGLTEPQLLPRNYTAGTFIGVSTSAWVASGDAVSPLDALKNGLTFNTCGQTGQDGPTAGMCAGEYGGIDAITDNLVVTSGIQHWTAPVDGTYRIEAWGAEGGGRYYGGSHCTGGLGGFAAGDIVLSAGETIQILVGQEGGYIDDSTTRAQGDGQGLNGAGGGGSFVVTSTNTPLIIAGGGGGRHPSHSNCTDTTIHGGQTDFSGDAAGPTQDGSSGGGGGGFTNNGSGNWGATHGCKGGDSFLNGGQGGVASQGQSGGCCGYTYFTTIAFASGGFGGGAGPRYWSSSAGGGGYSGGKGWNSVTTAASQSGGTNFTSGTDTLTIPGQQFGHGKVRVTLK